MNKKINELIKTILPNKKENLLILSLLIIGMIAGTTFLLFLSDTDKTLVTQQVSSFFQNIQNNNINYGQTFLNGIILNITYLFIMWVLGLSMLGLPINLFLVFLKGFLISFTISAILYIYSWKGLVAVCIYVIPIQLLQIISFLLIGVYTYHFSKNLFIAIKYPQNNFFKKNFKKYSLILIISFLLSTISLTIETYLFPIILKLVINLFV